MADLARLAWRDRFLTLILIGVAIVTTLYQLTFRYFLPTNEDYSKVVEELQKDSSIPVLVVPMWAERIRTMVDNPVVALPPEDRDIAALGHFWALVTPSPWSNVNGALDILSGRFGAPTITLEHGNLTMLKYEFEVERPKLRFLDHLATTTVRQGGRICPATKDDTRHQCDRTWWNYVEVQVREFDYLPRTCLWAHPVKGEPLSISFPNISIGESINVRAGMVGRSGLNKRLAPVELRVDIDGVPTGGLIAPARPGFPLTTIPTPGVGSKTVTFTVTTSNQALRHFCFDAWIPQLGEAP